MMENSCDLLLVNANAVIPKVGVVKTNILIENGKIKDITNDIGNISCSKRIDVNDKFVLPGIIDPHVHYGVFSPVSVSSETESRSAAVGGITTIMRMLRNVGSYKQIISKHLEASQHSHFIDYSIHASIFDKKQLNDVPYLDNLGITSFKLYMNLGSSENRILMDMDPYTSKLTPEIVNVSDELCYDLLEKLSHFNAVVLVHAEDHVLCSKLISQNKDLGLVSGNNNSMQLDDLNPLDIWSKSRPPESETIAIKKIMQMARKFGSRLYFVHIGSNQALDTILKEKQYGGCTVYTETCPHYLTHSVEYANIKGKVVPPLRSKSDIASLWMALRNGVIDTIGTDHVANVLDLKYGEGNDLWTALAGFPGLATMLPVLLNFGVNSNRLSIEKVVDLTSYNASRIFGLYPIKGTIQKESDADLAIVDLDLVKKVTPEILQSSSDYTIYDGATLQGWPIMTICRGEVIMENGIVYEDKLGHGKFVKRIKSLI
jgi:dihydropyrimidinase